jgi:hypothetical protein
MDRQRAAKYTAIAVAAGIAGAAGLVGSSLISDNGQSSNPRITIFCSEFVPNIEASNLYSKWAGQNQGERDKWIAYRTTICADSLPVFPVMATAFGKALVAAGKMALTIDVPPPTTTSSTTTTTAPPPTTTTTTTTTAPPPGVTYPASYYTGPLGANNILPTKQGAFLFTMFGLNGGAYTSDTWRAGVLQRETDMGRKYDGVHMHYGGNGTLGGVANCISGDSQEQWIHDTGHIVLVSWEPNRTIADVNAGLVDGCFQAVAQRFKAFNFQIMLRIGWEFDGQWAPFSGCGQPFIDAWRRVVGIFKAQSATNVGFWWTPTEGANRSCVNISYPGDAYVDWVGSDGYNRCYVVDPTCYATPPRSGWAEFSEVFDYAKVDQSETQQKLWGPHKPFIIGETSTTYDSTSSTTQPKKGQWFRNIPAAAKNMQWLRGIAFYDVDVSAEENTIKSNFRVSYPESDPSAFAGFKALAADPWFNAR